MSTAVHDRHAAEAQKKLWEWAVFTIAAPIRMNSPQACDCQVGRATEIELNRLRQQILACSQEAEILGREVLLRVLRRAVQLVNDGTDAAAIIVVADN